MVEFAQNSHQTPPLPNSGLSSTNTGVDSPTPFGIEEEEIIEIIQHNKPFTSLTSEVVLTPTDNFPTHRITRRASTSTTAFVENREAVLGEALGALAVIQRRSSSQTWNLPTKSSPNDSPNPSSPRVIPVVPSIPPYKSNNEMIGVEGTSMEMKKNMESMNKSSDVISSTESLLVFNSATKVISDDSGDDRRRQSFIELNRPLSFVNLHKPTVGTSTLSLPTLPLPPPPTSNSTSSSST